MRAPAAQPEQPDHYAVLGVSATATPRQITHAYRALVRALHPDTSTAPGDTRAQFTAVTTAYTVLHDPARRSAYDQTRHTQTRPDPGSNHDTAPRTHATIPAPPAADATHLGPPAHHDTCQPLLRAGPTRVSPLPQRGP